MLLKSNSQIVLRGLHGTAIQRGTAVHRLDCSAQDGWPILSLHAAFDTHHQAQGPPYLSQRHVLLVMHNAECGA